MNERKLLDLLSKIHNTYPYYNKYKFHIHVAKNKKVFKKYVNRKFVLLYLLTNIQHKFPQIDNEVLPNTKKIYFNLYLI